MPTPINTIPVARTTPLVGWWNIQIRIFSTPPHCVSGSGSPRHIPCDIQRKLRPAAMAEFDFRYSYRIKTGYDDTARADRALKGIVGKRLTYRTTIGAGAEATPF